MKKIIRILAAVFCICLCLGSISCKENVDPPVMEYKDVQVSQSLYSYWLSTYKSSFLYAYNEGIDSDEFWDTLISDDMTYEEYITDWVNTEMKYRTVAIKLFDEYDLELSEKDIDSISKDIDEKIEYAGSREALNRELAEMGMNIDMLREVYIANQKYDRVYAYLYGSGGKELPNEKELASYFADNYYCLKYITIYSGAVPVTDENGNYVYAEDGTIELQMLTDEEKAAKQEVIDLIVDGIEAGGDFEEYISEFSEVDYSRYPNGFFVSANDYSTYGSDIINAAVELGIGEVKTLSDENVTYILKKYELPAYASLSSTEKDNLQSLSEQVIREKYVEKFDELAQDVSVNEELTGMFSIRQVSENSYF